EGVRAAAADIESEVKGGGIDRVRAAGLVERSVAAVSDDLGKERVREGAVAEVVGTAAAGLISEVQVAVVDRVRAAVLVERSGAAAVKPEVNGGVADRVRAALLVERPVAAVSDHLGIPRLRKAAVDEVVGAAAGVVTPELQVGVGRVRAAALVERPVAGV